MCVRVRACVRARVCVCVCARARARVLVSFYGVRVLMFIPSNTCVINMHILAWKLLFYAHDKLSFSRSFRHFPCCFPLEARTRSTPFDNTGDSEAEGDVVPQCVSESGTRKCRNNAQLRALHVG